MMGPKKKKVGGIAKKRGGGMMMKQPAAMKRGGKVKKGKKKSVKKMTVSKGVEKKNLDEFDVTDGKERGKDDIKEEKELDGLLGGPQLNPYGTLSKDVFEERLNSSSASELKDLAARVGVPRERNSTLLKKSLLQSFESYASKQSANDEATVRLANVLKGANEEKRSKRQKNAAADFHFLSFFCLQSFSPEACVTASDPQTTSRFPAKVLWRFVIRGVGAVGVSALFLK